MNEWLSFLALTRIAFSRDKKNLLTSDEITVGLLFYFYMNFIYKNISFVLYILQMIIIMTHNDNDDHRLIIMFTRMRCDV